MNLSLTFGAPIVREIEGVKHTFSRLCMRDYAEVVDAWLNAELSDVKDEDAKAKIKDLVRNNIDGYVFDKIMIPQTAIVLINKSLSLNPATKAMEADKLAMDPEELCDLAAQIWSRTMQLWYQNTLQKYRARVSGIIMEEPPAPKAQEPASQPTG